MGNAFNSADFAHIFSEKPLSIQEKARTDTLRINEIFYSIQGESSRSGEPCVFVRLTGCGLRCDYCDTEYAFFEGTDMMCEAVMDQIRSYGSKLVELTGGEPLEQEGIYDLMGRLMGENYRVMIETGGHVDIGRVNPSVKRIVDLKTPSSKMMHRNLYENIEHLTKNDEVKFVIAHREDYEWSRDQIQTHSLNQRCGAILISPVHDALELETLASWILEDHLPVKMQVQLHKLIWPGVTRGV